MINRRAFLKYLAATAGTALLPHRQAAYASPLIPPPRPQPLRAGVRQGTLATDLARRWALDDAPLAANGGGRWTWGAQVIQSSREVYHAAPSGLRNVWYFDKGRLEISNPDGDPDDARYVSSGALVREMVSGVIDLGNGKTERHAPALLPVAGDHVPANETVTYADLWPHASLDGERRSEPRGDQVIDQIIDSRSVVRRDERYASYGVRYGRYEDIRGHNIAAIWDETFGPERIDELGGAPLTEPFWIAMPLNGAPTDVLIQLFERRVLTYTPSNSDGARVAWGDVGRHYVQWRYDRDSEPFDPRAALEPVETRPLSDLSPAVQELIGQRGDTVGIAVFDLRSGVMYESNGTQPFPTYSTVKVAVMIMTLDRAMRAGRGLTENEDHLIRIMIQQSDNAATSALLRSLGGAAALTHYLRTIGIENTTVDPVGWGSTQTTPQDMARLLSKLANGLILTPDLRAYALDVMRGVIDEQRWGVSAGVPAEGSIAIKNGWYPKPRGWVINSIGLIKHQQRLYAIAAYTTANATMGSGINTIEDVARRINETLT